MKHKRSNQLGMTLIEIMVVIAILGLIASAVAINAVQNYKSAQRERAAIDIKTIENALQLHLVKNGTYPDPLRGLAGLKLQSTRDPWGNDYVHKLKGGKPVVLSSRGAGGAPIVGCPEECPPGYETTETKEEPK